MGPLVSVFDASNAGSVVAQANLPAVMTAPIRPDIVNYVHNLMSKNSRQAYAVSKMAVCRHLQCLGELDVLCHVSLLCLVVVPPDPVKVRSEICAVAAACSRPLRSGADGTERSM